MTKTTDIIDIDYYRHCGTRKSFEKNCYTTQKDIVITDTLGNLSGCPVKIIAAVVSSNVVVVFAVNDLCCWKGRTQKEDKAGPRLTRNINTPYPSVCSLTSPSRKIQSWTLPLYQQPSLEDLTTRRTRPPPGYHGRHEEERTLGEQDHHLP